MVLLAKPTIFIGFCWFSLSELTLDRRHAYSSCARCSRRGTIFRGEANPIFGESTLVVGTGLNLQFLLRHQWEQYPSSMDNAS